MKIVAAQTLPVGEYHRVCLYRRFSKTENIALSAPSFFFFFFFFFFDGRTGIPNRRKLDDMRSKERYSL